MAVKFDKLLGKIREKDGGGEIPIEELDKRYAKKEGTYPDLIAGGLVARDSDSIVDNRTSFIFRSAGGDKSITDGFAKLTEIFGNVVNGVPFSATHFQAIGFNAFNPVNILNKTINPSTGEITDSEEHKIAFIHVIAGQVGTGNNNGYIISSDDEETLLINTVGFTTQDPTTATQATILTATPIDTTRSAYIPPQNGYLLIDCFNAALAKLCVHLAWSYNPQNYKEYSVATINIPQLHSWGLGKAGNAMDEINFLHQQTITRVNRILMTNLEWVEEATEHQREVPDPEDPSRYITVTYYTYTYTSEKLVGSIKPATTNISHYGLSDTITPIVGYDGKITIDSGETQLSDDDFAGIYLYYELDQYIYAEETLDPIYAISDFGTEEFLNTPVPPTYATFFYLPNYYDGIRQVVNRDSAMRQYTINFRETDDNLAQDRNMLGAVTIDRVICDNVSTVYLTVGNLVQHRLTLTNGESTEEIQVPDGALVTWEITRTNSGQRASIGVRYRI